MNIRSRIVRWIKGLPPAVRRPIHHAVEEWRDLSRAAGIRELFKVNEWEEPACAICGGAKALNHRSFNGFRIVRCPGDGLLFVSPRPTDLAPFYGQTYYVGGARFGYRDYHDHASRSAIDWDQRLADLEARSQEPGTLLDVGCATGAFLERAANRGWKCTGMDISRWAVTEAARGGRVHVLQGALPDSRLPGQAFDAVTMFDCLEHLANPGEALRDVRRVLKPLGTLVLTTGAVPHQDPDYSSQWIFPPWHLYYFSKETLLELLRRSGFDVVRCEIVEGLMSAIAVPKREAP